MWTGPKGRLHRVDFFSFLLALSCPCQCFGLSVATCGSLRVPLRSQRINTPLQIETSTRTIHNHILCLFCGGDAGCVCVCVCVRVLTVAQTHSDVLKQQSILRTHSHAHRICKDSLDSLCFSRTRRVFAALHNRQRKKRKSVSSYIVKHPPFVTP